MKKIWIVDDDVYIGAMLEEVLHRAGYGVRTAYSGTEALLLLERETPDLVLLDLMLPGLSGEELLAKLQGIPVIVISAKAEVEDKVDLLLRGAADYLTKPFDTKELLARIAVQLRSAAAAGTSPRLTYGSLELDTRAHTLQARGVPIHLTKTEFALLRQLLQNAPQVVTKSQLLELVHWDTPDCVEGSLKVHISNLRRKLREATGCDYVESVWGIGFRLQEQ